MAQRALLGTGLRQREADSFPGKIVTTRGNDRVKAPGRPEPSAGVADGDAADPSECLLRRGVLRYGHRPGHRWWNVVVAHCRHTAGCSSRHRCPGHGPIDREPHTDADSLRRRAKPRFRRRQPGGRGYHRNRFAGPVSLASLAGNRSCSLSSLRGPGQSDCVFLIPDRLESRLVACSANVRARNWGALRVADSLAGKAGAIRGNNPAKASGCAKPLAGVAD